MASKAPATPVKTVLTISMGLIVIYLAKHWMWALYTSLGIGLVGLFSLYLAEKIDFLWMKLAYYLGMVSRTILLGAVFYVFLFPISLLSKLFAKKDPLLLKNNANSTYMVVNKVFEKDTFDKIW